MAPTRSPGAPASATGARINSNASKFSALGTSEQAAAQAIGFGDKSPTRELVLRAFRPLAKGKLRGFASVELPCGLVLIDLPVFIGRNGPWAALPRKAVLDSERRQKLDPNGKPSFQAIAEWCTRALADAFSASVIELIAAAYPDAFDGTA